jgi:uncharacterized membrane protein YcaP (DUF421 family)
MFFGSWESLLRTLVVGVLAYLVLVAFLRVSGKRTLSKLNAFDLVVTVALGSTLATVLLNTEIALADGAIAFALLIGLQFVITWSSVRARWVRQVVTGEPTMLVYGGEPIPSALRRVRVTEDEVMASARSAGLASLDEAKAIVLETDGSISVVPLGGGATGRSTLAPVRRTP